MNALCQYHWPGNIRELQNVVERAVIMTKDAELRVPVSALKMRVPSNLETFPTMALDHTLELQEREMIEAALAECGGRVSGPDGAATKLAIPRPTLDARIKRLGINKYQFRAQVPN
jgi:formate hydrogenlyase transcriptional activator